MLTQSYTNQSCLWRPGKSEPTRSANCFRGVLFPLTPHWCSCYCSSCRLLLLTTRTDMSKDSSIGILCSIAGSGTDLHLLMLTQRVIVQSSETSCTTFKTISLPMQAA